MGDGYSKKSNQIYRFAAHLNFEISILTTCRSGEIGKRARLRSVCRKAWEFESPLRYLIENQRVVNNSIHNSFLFFRIYVDEILKKCSIYFSCFMDFSL
jgi:hypothetical protein